MTKAVPSRLPPPFHWVEEPDRKRLCLGGIKVLEICRRNLGWIVEVIYCAVTLGVVTPRNALTSHSRAVPADCPLGSLSR